MAEIEKLECPKCKSKNIKLLKESYFDEDVYTRKCGNCGYELETF